MLCRIILSGIGEPSDILFEEDYAYHKIKKERLVLKICYHSDGSLMPDRNIQGVVFMKRLNYVGGVTLYGFCT